MPELRGQNPAYSSPTRLEGMLSLRLRVGEDGLL